ncbi:hypothetical protein Bbelb_406090 [Branchiostoma belcheri]|nr:hypothetical protein Bbelb_406090 [Branchiostoma belcheri]
MYHCARHLREKHWTVPLHRHITWPCDRDKGIAGSDAHLQDVNGSLFTVRPDTLSEILSERCQSRHYRSPERVAGRWGGGRANLYIRTFPLAGSAAPQPRTTGRIQSAQSSHMQTDRRDAGSYPLSVIISDVLKQDKLLRKATQLQKKEDGRGLSIRGVSLDQAEWHSRTQSHRQRCYNTATRVAFHRALRALIGDRSARTLSPV